MRLRRSRSRSSLISHVTNHTAKVPFDVACDQMMSLATKWGNVMNVIVFASRKGGSGKSTLVAHLAASLHKASRSCCLIDTDPQGSLTLWHRMRKSAEPVLKNGLHNLSQTIETAQQEGVEWVLVDTPPLVSHEVSEAISSATLIVIPARPNVFDLNAITETIAVARSATKPFAVILNGVLPKRLGSEASTVMRARQSLADLGAPVWSGQITQRANLALTLSEGLGAHEYNVDAKSAADEMDELWSAIERSVDAIHGAYHGAAMHERAA
jgi:chromosome partitioning protein